MRDEALILFVNDAFYEAFKAGDLAAMEKLWAKEACVVCAHPGWVALYGREQVMGSWQAIFSSGGFPRNLRCRNPRIVPLGPDHAMVLCYEEIGEAVLLATNVFGKEKGQWRLLHHHAGPTELTADSLPAAPEREALQ